LKLLNLYRFIAAAHLTHAVDAVPSAFSQCGGVMLVAPPEQMKSTAVKCLDGYGDCLVLSDLNVRQLAKHLRDEISSGRYHTLALTAFEKLYARDQDTAMNIEASLSAMMEEGFGHASFEDSRSFVRVAKCLVVGALVESSYRAHYSHWLESGFARRFLWLHFKLKDPMLLTRAIVNWEPLSVANGEGLPALPYGNNIPWSTTKEELFEIHKLIKEQPGKSTPHILCAKTLSVLKWHFRQAENPAKEAWFVFLDVSSSFRMREGAVIEIEGAKPDARPNKKV
jgi:hypothetical protein